MMRTLALRHSTSRALRSWRVGARVATCAIGLSGAACSGPAEVDVRIVNPCNRPVLGAVDFLRFEPRGTNIDSAQLTTIARAEDLSTPDIKFARAPDLRLVVTGHKGSFDAPVAAAGVSAEVDTEAAKGPLSMLIPLIPVDEFVKTTKLAEPDTCTQMTIARYGATATYVPSNGRVIIIGGATDTNGSREYKRSIEAYDPGTGEFTIVAELPFGGQRMYHTATLLEDGRILVAGGEATIDSKQEALKSALLVDVRDLAAVRVSATVQMRSARTGHTATKLADGRVVVIGGRVLASSAVRPQDHEYLATIEVFDPSRNLFVVPMGMSNLDARRYGHSASPLPKGTDILVAGGMNELGPVRNFEVVRLEQESARLFTSTTTLSAGPIFHAATVTDEGYVVLSGGYGSIADAEPNGGLPQNASANVEVLEWREADGRVVRRCNDQLAGPRGFHSVSVAKQRVVFVGGRGAQGATVANAEVARLTPDSARCFASRPTSVQMADERARHAVATLGSGEFLIVGGLRQGLGDQFATSVPSVEIFSPARF